MAAESGCILACASCLVSWLVCVCAIAVGPSIWSQICLWFGFSACALVCAAEFWRGFFVGFGKVENLLWLDRVGFAFQTGWLSLPQLPLF